MPTTYTNGLKLPDLGSIDWYGAYKNNIDILDPIVGTVNEVSTNYAPISHNHDASEITSGTIDIARLPPAALERMHIVANQAARYALTTSTVQEGDTVKQSDTGVMYLVVDSTKLNSADGYTEYSAGTAAKATADADGNTITDTYATITDLSTLSDTVDTKADDDSVVHLTGEETITGDKTWTGSNTFTGTLTGTLTGLASQATSDADGNVITDTYATVTALSTLSDTVDTKADDSDVVHIADAETITGAKTFSATVTSADVVPSATDTYSLGSASYQYNAVYGATYYYNGTQWGLDQKNEWTNYQRMIDNPTVWYLRNDTVTLGTAPSSNRYLGMFFEDVNGTTLGYTALQVSKNGYNSIVFNLKNSDGTDTYVGGFRCTASPTGDYSLFPESDASIDLGTSTNKWKSLNGINPGALSLPNIASYSDIKASLTANLDLTTDTFSWTATVTGYLHIVWYTRYATAPYSVYIYRLEDGITNLVDFRYCRWGQTFSMPVEAWVFLTTTPVVAGQTYIFWRSWVREASTDASVINSAFFVPSLGNV